MDHTKSWHFARYELAKTYIQTLQVGPQCLAVFAERRKGKTEFLTEDVMPLADKQGLRCCYVNFWADRNNPVACLVNGIEQSLKAQHGGFLRNWKKEVSLNIGGLQAKMIERQGPDIQSANAAMQYLMEPKGAVLLLCDEVQHLATRQEFEDFTASLRTFIDTHKARLRVIFTGSSQDNLNRLFRNQRAAFYNSASITPFPDMGVEFAEFLVRRFAYLSGRNLPANSIFKVFVEHHNSPAFIVDLLYLMLKEGIYSVEDGIEAYNALNPPDEDNLQTWNQLTALDREVIKRLAEEHPRPLYNPQVYTEISGIIGTPIGQGAIQGALARMREQGILINAGRGNWQFENSSFKTYVANLITGEK